MVELRAAGTMCGERSWESGSAAALVPEFAVMLVRRNVAELAEELAVEVVGGRIRLGPEGFLVVVVEGSRRRGC